MESVYLAGYRPLTTELELNQTVESLEGMKYRAVVYQANDSSLVLRRIVISVVQFDLGKSAGRIG